ncbi:MAG: response regulator [Candidatus Eisenbacteria bacterium]|uniref:histidine kinase n=1 Tax=Eiseniibacteriota bacterium TaxID=2212470 RepID=A0A849SF61_UNCEI|nr:response regulator [Candidatus Eisenbacteria bacterium]
MDKPRVLVVDDEETLVYVIRSILETNGCEVITAGSAESALTQLEANAIDVAVCDIVLPGMNGLQLLASIKHRRPEIEVLIMTSHASIDTAVQALRAGAYDYLHKPFDDIEEVWTHVSRALEKSRLTRENRQLLEHQARLNAQLSDKLRSLRTLVEAGQEMSKLTRVPQLLDLIVGRVKEVLEAERVSVMLLDEHRQTLRIAASYGMDHLPLDTIEVPMGEGVAGSVASNGEPVLVTRDDPTDSFMSAPVRMSVPLPGWRETIGVINVTARRSGVPFSPDDLQLLMGLAGLVASSVERVRHTMELQRAYDSLKNAQDQMIASEKLKAIGQMAAGVAHDFNNILAIIAGRAASGLRAVNAKKPDIERIRQYLEPILQAAREGAATVKRIQDYSRIRRDQPRGAVNLNTVVQDAVELSRPKWKTEPGMRGAAIDVVQELDEIPMIRGDIPELGSVLSNLLFNAVEAMPQGGHIVIRTRRQDDRVRLDVEDSGVGMSDETQRRLFEPFFTTKETGQGLGMSIVHGILMRHGAEIQVDSRENGGTRYSILLPLATEPAPTVVALPRGAPPAPGMRILLVDDDARVRASIADELEHEGHELLAIGDSRSALEAIEAQEFDVVVTDLSMPGLTGIDLAARCKERRPHLPVILMSGRATEQIEAEVQRARIDYVISKPFTSEELLSVIGVLTRARRAA